MVEVALIPSSAYSGSLVIHFDISGRLDYTIQQMSAFFNINPTHLKGDNHISFLDKGIIEI